MANKEKREQQTKDPVSIIGIGASAGGLGALKSLFSHIPHDTGLAYVVVVHLSPEYKSMMADLLRPHVNIPVSQVTETVPIERDHIYVIPPNANLNTVDTHLRLSKLEDKRWERAPIDHFFKTLADTHDGNAVGIILTGTGTDGTLGLQSIKERGGLTLVQDPDEAEFDGMPTSAIAGGQVDAVLTLDKIPDYFLKFVNTNPQLKGLEKGEIPDDENRQQLQKIFAQIRSRTGRDYSRYKLSTIMRRLQRRMQLYQIEELESYLNYLLAEPEEVKALSDEFLINVTSFFRDPPVYQHLQKVVIPRLFDQHQSDEQLRVWSVGCATGEEAYTLGMLLIEESSKREESPMLQIFASDLHEGSLSKAREGLFQGEIKEHVSPERLKRFFLKEELGYRVRKELREMIIFTPHNLLSNPPFSKIDLIVCRNLLIYLKKDVQSDIFELFHYSLNPDGYLLLGSSEHLDNSSLFRTENKELSFYQKRNVTGPEPRLPVFPKVNRRFASKVEEETSKIASSSYGQVHQQMVENYAPPSILLSSDYQVLHVSQNAGRYLTISGGELSKDIFKLIRAELQMELRSVIYSARDHDVLMRAKPVVMQLDGNKRNVIVSARIQNEKQEEQAILIFFEEYEKSAAYPEGSEQADADEGSPERIKELENQLQEGRQRLQAIIEEYETNREEMKASNEEQQSANEELRSTMEELETSKEELQSMNEELTTLNQEYRYKVVEMDQLNDDLQNLLSATDIATLFLDRDLHILRFTPKLGELFNVKAVDKGRPISDQTHKLGYDDLTKDAQEVLRRLGPIEKEVKAEDGQYYHTRILPYRSSDDRIEGVVITFLNITSRKNAEEDLRKSQEKLKLALEAANMGVWNLDLNTMVAETTLSHNQLYGYTHKVEEWTLKKIREHIISEDRERFDQEYQQALETGMLDLEFRIQWPDGTTHWIYDRARTYYNSEGQAVRMTGVSVETTAKKLISEDHRKSDAYYHLIFEKQSFGYCLFNPVHDESGEIQDFEVVESNQAFERFTETKLMSGKKLSAQFAELNTWPDLFRKALSSGQVQYEPDSEEKFKLKLKIEVLPLVVDDYQKIAVLLRRADGEA